MSTAKELKAFVEQVLDEERVGRPYLFAIANNGHQQVTFYVKGIRVKYQFPFSASDHRSMLNSRSSIRKAIRSASRHALSGAPAQRSVLHAGSVLPSQPHYVGGRGAGVHKHPPAVSHAGLSGFGQTLKTARGS